jgi:hypothetical protein
MTTSKPVAIAVWIVFWISGFFTGLYVGRHLLWPFG